MHVSPSPISCIQTLNHQEYYKVLEWKKACHYWTLEQCRHVLQSDKSSLLVRWSDGCVQVWQLFFMNFPFVKNSSREYIAVKEKGEVSHWHTNTLIHSSPVPHFINPSFPSLFSPFFSLNETTSTAQNQASRPLQLSVGYTWPHFHLWKNY